MSIVINVIISAFIVVALFWILHNYAVCRARYLVKLQLGSGDAETINAVSAYKTIDTCKDYKNTQASARIESLKVKWKNRKKQPIPPNEKWRVISN